jgi:hypothetical protein
MTGLISPECYYKCRHVRYSGTRDEYSPMSAFVFSITILRLECGPVSKQCDLASASPGRMCLGIPIQRILVRRSFIAILAMKGLPMVMALVSELGMARPVCLTRIYLHRAANLLQAGDLIAAGCLMREAIKRYLTALCEYHNCDMGRKRERTPTKLLGLLWSAKKICPTAHLWMKDAIEVGNKSAHCQSIRKATLRTCIELMHSIVDHTPEIVFPTREGSAL